MAKKYIKAAIFDLDGTLIDSKKDIIDSINYILKALGFKERPDDIIQRYIGRGRDKLIEDSLGREATPEMVDKANTAFNEFYRAHMFDHTKLFPGVLDILEYLKDKTLMLVTNKDRDLAVATLKRFNIDKYFSKVMGGEDQNCRKPHSCPISSLLEGIDVLPHQAMIIGDSEIDIKAGKIAGILTCGLTWGIGSRESIEAVKPDYILGDMRQLKEIIY
ncbi:MAG: HAD-IA family hydrolase [Candidatus Omnitrophica bacterium]|nr:HAD-IA family hydrolase [Candidatus Omnitrophota bacterium]MBU4488141.1 HAD-IA family hydrolase [Candidatus Omnitrophota bacterium]MCG2704528.1 HAD-IA family hydrolase [Candidatus Omnitrophota bacterium]